MKDTILVFINDPGISRAQVDRVRARIDPSWLSRARIGRLEFSLPDGGALDEVRTILGELGIDTSTAFVQWQRTYTKAELSRAPLLWLTVNRAPKGLGGPAHGTAYDLSTACSKCGTGARQLSPLKVRSRELERRGEITETLNGEVLIAPHIAERLRWKSLAGLRLIPVESIDGNEPLPWVQILADDALPPMSSHSTGFVTERQCERCRRDGFYVDGSAPLEIAYELDIGSDAVLPDVVHTWEHFGKSGLRSPFVQSSFAPPGLLVKARVYELLKAVRGCRFDPVRIMNPDPAPATL